MMNDYDDDDGDDVDSDIYDEEETLVLVDFPDFDGTNFIASSQSVILQNMFSSQPTCVVDGIEFIGTYENTLGSRILVRKNIITVDLPEDNHPLINDIIKLCQKRIKFILKSIPQSEIRRSENISEIPVQLINPNQEPAIDLTQYPTEHLLEQSNMTENILDCFDENEEEII